MEENTAAVPARPRFRQPINLIDKFYIALHEVSQTMIYLADFHVSGELSFEHFKEAYLATLDQLPVLKSVIRGKGGWFSRLWWEEVEKDYSDTVELVDLYQDGRIAEEEAGRLYEELFRRCSNTRWDIRTENPIRAKLVRRGKETWSIFFLIHHAVADGHGTKAILEVFAANYSLVAGGETPSRTPIPQKRRSYLKFILGTNPLKMILTFFYYIRYELMNRPRASTPFLTEWKQREGVIRSVDFVLNRTVTRKLVERCRMLGITLNEAMILACARCVDRWVRSRGRTPGKISIAVPVNMRPYLGLSARESVANCSVTMNINIRASLLGDAARLIETIRFQSRGLKKLRFPLVGIVQAAFLSWFPLRVLERLMRQSIESGVAARNTATIVYSNVGMIFVDERGEPFLIPLGPSARVTGLRFSNPISYPVAAAMATVTYGGKVLFSLSYLDPVLERPLMEALAGEYKRELFAVMDEKALASAELAPFSSELEESESAGEGSSR
jgi:NRPS condensation-like uncharacterized protein